VVSSERDFDRQYGHKKKEESKKKLCDYLEVNVGTNEEPRMVKIGKTTPIEERNEIVELLKEYRGCPWPSIMMNSKSIGRI
jgi:hypothetical protein